MLKANQKKHEWNLPFSHFLQCHISSDAKNKAYKENNTAPALKHGGASVMFLGLLWCIWHSGS